MKDYYLEGPRIIHEAMLNEEYRPGHKRYECYCGFPLSNHRTIAFELFLDHLDEVKRDTEDF